IAPAGTPDPEVVADGLPGRELAWEHAPLAAALEEVEDGIEDLSRRLCTLGRPGAPGVGKWGSMQDHSASDRSVGYVFLMRARVASQHTTTPFRTVSEG